MNAATCPHCDCTVFPTAARGAVVFCPHCGCRMASANEPRTQPGRRESESPSLLGGPCEEFTFSFSQALVRFLLVAPMITTIIAALIASIFCAINVSATVAGGLPPQRMLRLPLAVVQFFAFSWCCCAFVTFPVLLTWSLFGRTRKAWAQGKQLLTRIGRRRATFDLEECSWSVCRRLYLGSAKPRLVVTQGSRAIELGFTEEAAVRWTEYFEAIGVYRTPGVHWPRLLLASVMAVVVGGAAGFLLERLVPLIGGPANLQGRLVFLGFLDGGMVILYRLAVRNRQYGRTARLGGMSVTMITLGAFAFQACGLVWEIVGTNAAIGAILGWFLFPRKKSCHEGEMGSVLGGGDEARSWRGR